MQPATRLKRIVPHLHAWSSFHPQWKVDFSSYAVTTPAGVVYIDPLQPAPSVAESLRQLGEPLGVFLTSASHERDADWFRKQFEVQIYAHEKAKPDCDLKLDVLVLDGEKMPGGLTALYLPGSGAGETGYYTPQDGGILLLGDAVLHPPRGGLTLLPDQYCEDSRRARRSLERVRPLDFKVVTFAHGAPLTRNAKRQLLQLSESFRKPKTTS